MSLAAQEPVVKPSGIRSTVMPGAQKDNSSSKLAYTRDAAESSYGSLSTGIAQPKSSYPHSSSSTPPDSIEFNRCPWALTPLKTAVTAFPAASLFLTDVH